MGAVDRTEFLAHYRCNTWGLQRSLDSYISSFIAYKFENQRHNYRRGSVVAYSDAGFVLIDVSSYSNAGSTFEKRSLCVANPVSQECIEIDAPKAFENSGIFWPFGIATRTNNGVVTSYKIVAFSSENLGLMIYSSETGLWSRKLHLHSKSESCPHTISLNGNLHWLSRNNDELVSMDFNATNMASGPFRYTDFPDLEKRVKFARACTTYQGSLMYINIVSQDGSVDHKLCVWRLKSWEWQLISEISTALTETKFDYIPLRINSCDATTAYFLSQKHKRLIAINLRNGERMLHRELELSSVAVSVTQAATSGGSDSAPGFGPVGGFTSLLPLPGTGPVGGFTTLEPSSPGGDRRICGFCGGLGGSGVSELPGSPCCCSHPGGMQPGGDGPEGQPGNLGGTEPGGGGPSGQPGGMEPGGG
ncbi:hypothetical protein YC2023_045447 [Brassica napus]